MRGQGRIETETLVIMGIAEHQNVVDPLRPAPVDTSANQLRANALPAVGFSHRQR